MKRPTHSYTFFLFVLSAMLLPLASSSYASVDLRAVGKYEELGTPQFFAGIYTAEPYSSADDFIGSQQDKTIEIRVVANKIYARRFKRMWLEGTAINSSAAEYKQHTENMVRFSAMLDVTLNKNDILRFERKQSEGMTLKLNGEPFGMIGAPDFFDMLARVLIGPVPISAELKKAILSSKPEEELLAEFNEIKSVRGAQRSSESLASISQESMAVAIDLPKIAAPSEVKGTPKAKPKTVASVSRPKPKPKPEPARPISAAEKNVATVAPSANENDTSSATVAVVASLGGRELINTKAVTEAEKREIEDLQKRIAGDRKSELIARQKYYSGVVSKVVRGMKNIKKEAPMGGSRVAKVRVGVGIVVKLDGNVKKIEIVSGAGNKNQNKAAIRAIELAAPFGKFPSQILDDELEMTVPVPIDWIYTTELDRAGLL